MKITILQSNFAKSLNAVSRIVGTRTTLPVLSNILVRALKGKIIFSATDLEVGISTQVIGKIDEEGELTLPAKLLSDFVLNNRDEAVEISTDGVKASLKSSHFEATMQGISAEEFPSVPEAPKETYITLKKAEFADALKKVAVAPASDETRPVLAGVYFSFRDTELILAATDSFRLAEKKFKLPKEVEEKKIIVPARTINEILRVLSSSDSTEEISLTPTDNQITFKIGDTYVVSRLIEGAFPNYTQIIPAAFKTTATVKHTEFVSAVKMSSLFARGSANNNIKIIIKKNELVVASAGSQIGSARSTVEAIISGDGLEVTFNARYLIDVLGVLNDESVQISLNDSSSAGVITAKSDKGYIYIIMPLKLEN